MIKYITLSVLLVMLAVMVMYVLFRGYFGKRSFAQIIYYMIKHSALIVVFSLLYLLVIYAKKAGERGGLYFPSIDNSFFISIVLTASIAAVVELLRHAIMNYLEDRIKLTEDYQSLLKKYSAPLAKEEGSWYVSSSTGEQIPEILCQELFQREFRIHDEPMSMYALPEILKDYRHLLFQAHDTSNVYNQLNIRVKDWHLNANGSYSIETERTTYYDSLVTNRAVDFELENGLTVRELLFYGPFVKKLSESELSNHLGFNGVLVSEDGYVPFVFRNSHISTGKRCWGASVQASLKAKYALKDGKNLTFEGMKEAMLKEIEDELKIDSKRGLVTEDNYFGVIASYRDLVEGGKPQLIMYVKSSWSKSFISENFRKTIKSKRKKNLFQMLTMQFFNPVTKESEEMEDGYRLLWIPLDSGRGRPSLRTLKIYADHMFCAGEKYKILPSTAVTISYFLDFLKLHPEIEKKMEERTRNF